MKIDYKKRYEFQKEINLRKSEEIEDLKAQVDGLISLCEEKDEIIHSVDFLRDELTKNVNEVKKKKEEYDELIKQLKDMKTIMDEAIFEKKWKFIRFLIKKIRKN